VMESGKVVVVSPSVLGLDTGREDPAPTRPTTNEEAR